MGAMGAPALWEHSKHRAFQPWDLEAGMCWAGAVLSTLLSRNPGEEINQPLIYLGGQILLLNWFLIWTQFPSPDVQMSLR